MITLDGFEPIEVDEAARLLVSESGMDGGVSDIAVMLGCEPPVLRWAATLAKTTGWGPLRTRILSWSSLAHASFHSEVERVVSSLSTEDRELLQQLSACDAPFGWDVLEAMAPDASVEKIGRLEEARLLRRRTCAGIVTFVVPYSVRAFQRATTKLAPEPWLAAWGARASALRATAYGTSSRETLTELGAAVPLAARALFDASTADAGLALWIDASDAIFFADALPFDAPAFARAVVLADQRADVAARVQVRLIAGRALLERGDAIGAAALIREALVVADRDDLRADSLRSTGWAALALARFDEAKSAFEHARVLTDGEPRGQADATAGLGVLSLLTGDAATARALLAEAVAIHVVMRDAPRESAVRAMMELLPEGSTDVDKLVAQVGELRARGQRWREALALARLALEARDRGDVETERTRLLEARAAASLSGISASSRVRAMIEASDQKRPIVVRSEGRILSLPDGTAHDLGRHGALRRVLWELAVARRDRSGMAISTLEMIAAGWPGEKIQHEAATLRVYTTIRRLRGLGLGEAVVTRADGYLLDPERALSIE